MSTRYSFYSFDLEKKKEKNNIMSYFSDKHKLVFISNNKPISKKKENRRNYKLDYLYNNKKMNMMKKN